MRTPQFFHLTNHILIEKTYYILSAREVMDKEGASQNLHETRNSLHFYAGHLFTFNRIFYWIQNMQTLCFPR